MAFLTRLTNYKIVEEPRPETTAVEASLIAIRTAASANLPNDHAGLLLLMESRNSATDRVLARAVDSAATPAFASDDGKTNDWGGVEGAAEHWAYCCAPFSITTSASKR